MYVAVTIFTSDLQNMVIFKHMLYISDSYESPQKNYHCGNYSKCEKPQWLSMGEIIKHYIFLYCTNIVEHMSW